MRLPEINDVTERVVRRLKEQIAFGCKHLGIGEVRAAVRGTDAARDVMFFDAARRPISTLAEVTKTRSP